MDENAVRRIVARVLDLRDEDVDRLTRENCATWDSLRHIELVTEIEDLLGVDLRDEQVASLDSFDKIMSLVGD